METLSIVFACNKFHLFIYGRPFIIENDHKPLRQIFKKSITKSPPRIQIFLLALQKYEFEVTYISGRESVIADALSRAYLTDNTQEISDKEMDKYIHIILRQYPMSNHKLDICREETRKDATSTRPENNKDVPSTIVPYMPVCDEISVMKGLVLKDTRMVVPNSLRKEALQIIHTGHLGIGKCISRVKEVIYWPNINKQIKEMISTCTYCRDHRNQQPSEAIIHHEIPKTPWTKVATDIFHLYNKANVVIIDYTTRYLDIHKPRQL